MHHIAKPQRSPPDGLWAGVTRAVNADKLSTLGSQHGKDFRNSLFKCVPSPAAFSMGGSYRGFSVAGAGPVGAHLSQQRDVCFLSSHGPVLGVSFSLFIGTKEGYGPCFCPSVERNTQPGGLPSQTWGLSGSTGLLMSFHGILVLLRS